MTNQNTLPPHLTAKEKHQIVEKTFFTEKSESNTVKNLGNYLANHFGKLDGFQYKWNTLITSNPLLFECTDYVRVKRHVNNIITKKEIAAYKSGELTELYATFENMLVCNIKHYDRIMSFCTMVFLKYVRLQDDTTVDKNLENVPALIDMTPTQIWCAALSNTRSTKWELEYAWNMVMVNKDKEKTILEQNYERLYITNKIFAAHIEYAQIRLGRTAGFRSNYFHDETPNRKLAQVCQKFTGASAAFSEDQLNTINEYVQEQEIINMKLYASLYESMLKLMHGDESQFAIFIFNTEFFIYSTKFSIRVTKDMNGMITKEYLANSYECFVAEEGLVDTMKIQIEWAKYQLPVEYNYDKKIMKNLLEKMLNKDYKNIVCIKRTNDYGILCKAEFSGIFSNVKITETYLKDNEKRRQTEICFGKKNAANYLIDKGYYIFGTNDDVNKVMDYRRDTIVNHFMQYTVPVMEHMSTAIQAHIMSKNDIIDVVCSGILNPHKINNKNIRYTEMKSIANPRSLMSSVAEINEADDKFLQQGNQKKSYWKVREGDY